MADLMEFFSKCYDLLGLTGSIATVVGIYVLCGLRFIRSGFRGVYFRLGRAIKEVGEGPHWRPFPFYRLAVVFCGEQVKELPKGLQEVVTKDGITCRLEGGISYIITDLMKMETVVDDADEQMAMEASSEIRSWIASHTYEECREEELGKKMMEKVTRRTRRWGIKVDDLNIITFAPANPEARALVFLLDFAKRRAESAKIFTDSIDRIKDQVTNLQISPSVLLAAIAGVPLSVVSHTDQLYVLRDQLAALQDQLSEKEEEPSLTDKITRRAGELIPGADKAIEALAGKER